MLDRHDYAGDWQQRRKAYEARGLVDQLVMSAGAQDRFSRAGRVIEAMLNQVREVAHLVKNVPAATAAVIPPPVEDEG